MEDSEPEVVIVRVRDSKFDNFVAAGAAHYTCRWLASLTSEEAEQAIRITPESNRTTGIAEAFMMFTDRQGHTKIFVTQGWGWQMGSLLIDTPDPDVAMIVTDGIPCFIGHRWKKCFQPVKPIIPEYIIRDRKRDALILVTSEDIVVFGQKLVGSSLLPASISKFSFDRYSDGTIELENEFTAEQVKILIR